MLATTSAQPVRMSLYAAVSPPPEHAPRTAPVSWIGGVGLLTVALLAVIGATTHPAIARAQSSWSMSRPASSFDRHGLVDPAHAEKIRVGGTLSGGASDSGITGFVDYDIEVPTSGWYELTIQGGGLEVEYVFDPPPSRPGTRPVTIYGTSGDSLADDKVANIWIVAGAHTIRLQKYFWTGFPRISGFTLRAGDGTLAKSVRVALPDISTTIYRAGRCPSLEVNAGGNAAPTNLTVWLKDGPASPRVAGRVPVPAGTVPMRREWQIPCEQPGAYTLSFGENGGQFAHRDARSVAYEVIETAKPLRPSGKAPANAGATSSLQGTLVESIDPVRSPPDYSGGGESRVVATAAGTYRESGDTGFTRYQRTPGPSRQGLAEPSWFAYRLKSIEPQRPYLVEIDYPDDALRTFAIALRESAPLAYPVSGGVDSGGEFSRSGRMETHSLLFWPRAKDTRVTLLNAHDGRRAAAVRIRVYRIDAPLPPLPAPASEGRQFVNWYEEGGNYASMYGAPDEYSPGASVAAQRWVEAARYVGISVLAPTVVVYNFALYPSRFNRAFSRPDLDPLRRIVLLAERDGLRVLPELHPRADELDWPFAASADPKPNLLVSKGGLTNYYAGDGKSRSRPPLYNPVHPANQDWYVAMIGELADRYRDSPALMGVNLRLMQWANPALNNFHSLDWGYDDYTVGLFQNDTGLRVPAGDASPGGRITTQIARTRYDWLTGAGREAWVEWRCRKIAALYARIRDRVQQARPDLVVYSSLFAWDGMDRGSEALREAGIDVNLLASIPGVVLINALHTYGRREAEAVTTQRNRDLLLDPRQTALVPTGANGRALLTSASYLEAIEAVVPPAQLGFPANTKQTWTSAAANPAGRHAIERFAVQLAQTDAVMLGDGGNGYSLGQPVLREFLQEYRSLPAERFSARADARDPVAVWTLARPGDFVFYAVNRERYPARVSIQLAGTREIKRLSSGETIPLSTGVLAFVLQPYQVIAFKAPAGAAVTSVTIRIPPADQIKLKAQVAWLAALNASAAARSLDGQKRGVLTAAILEVEQEYRQNHPWRVRTLLESAPMLEIYRQLKRYPPAFAIRADLIEAQ